MIDSHSILRGTAPSTYLHGRSFCIFHVLGIVLLLTTLLGSSVQPARAAGTFVVDVAVDGEDAHKGDGICATGGGRCTLRAAIEEANANPDTDSITFNLPGSGDHWMQLSSALPWITSPVVLDGRSQPGCDRACIVLDGAQIKEGTNINGVLVYDGSTVKGLIVISWTTGRGIFVAGDNNVVQDNYVGLWPGNSGAFPNGEGLGVFGSNNLIGGALDSQRNVISGNAGVGITVQNGSAGDSTSSNVIQNNYVGTDPSGTGALANRQGISVDSQAEQTLIKNNLVSGNTTWGIHLFATTNATIVGNKIGTDAAGTGNLGNGQEGILIDQGSNGNIVGGKSGGDANVIAYNQWNGISIWCNDGINNHLQRNSIFSNGGLGIDLESIHTGVTANDTGDVDGGPNQLQNFPVLTAANSSAGGTARVIKGKLNSAASTTFTIEFFASPQGSCDPSHYGEGKRYIGAKKVTTDAWGNVSFSYKPNAFSTGEVITATATDKAGNTSEFSKCRTAK